MEFIVLAIFFAVMWALFVLPQQRRMRSQRAFVESLQVGEEVLTTAGVFGTILELDEATARLEIADGVVVTIARGAIGRSRADFEGEHDRSADRSADPAEEPERPADETD